MNEVNFGAPIPIGMASVLKQRLRPDTLRDVMLTGKQYTAPQALAAGIIDEVVSGEGEDVITRGLAIAEANKIHASTGVLGSMKRTLYSSVLEGLLTDEGMGTPAEENDARHKELLAQKQRDAKL
jgi:enoyl-CoA hydratase/carnithine racemase